MRSSNEEDAVSKHENDEDVDEDTTATKDSDSKNTEIKETESDRPSSSGKSYIIYFHVILLVAIYKCNQSNLLNRNRIILIFQD